MKNLFLILFMAASVQTLAQLPITDLYMVKLRNNGVDITLEEPVYLSGFNPEGYNNQPSFISPYEVYITSNLYDKKFTDFIRLDLLNNEYYRVTATDSISEFSPTPKAPNEDFSAVRIEKDGKTQTLHLYPSDHGGEGYRVLQDNNDIGYHCWLSDKEVALFLVGDIFQLAIGDIETGDVSVLMDNIGRGLRQNSNGNLLFIHKQTTDKWYLMEYNPTDGTTKILIETLLKSEDFELLTDGTIIMAEGGKIFSYHPDRNKTWKMVADFSELDIQNISRIAISRNKMIFVNTPK